MLKHAFPMQPITKLLLALSAVLASCAEQKQLRQFTYTGQPSLHPITLASGNPTALHNDNIYQFQLNSVNSAFYDVKFDVTKEKKDITIPSSLTAPFPNGTTTSEETEARHMKLATPVHKPQMPDKLEEDFTELKNYYTSGLATYKSLIADQRDTGACRTEASAAILTLSNHLGQPGNDADNLLALVKAKIQDFRSRFQLAKDKGEETNDDRWVDIYNWNTTIDSNEVFLLKLPVILKAYSQCLKSVTSPYYNIKKADYIHVNITVYGNKFTTHDSLCNLKTTFYRIHYWTFDVTSGTFFNTLASQSYHYTDTLGGYARESKSRSDLSLGALIHFHYVVSPAFKPGICVGAAVSVLDGKTKYLGGGSLTIGRRSEFSLSGGAAVSSLPAPSNGIPITGFKSTLGGTVPTYNKTTWGWFAGLTYSFIKN
jgi:hypothetical protein